ncbi:MAG TPA: hypothetical protein VFV83_11045 [Chthoniobacteraceae bacterium]|nr:hypothetical protein [Chthoniobacteraceae bacterium]
MPEVIEPAPPPTANRPEPSPLPPNVAASLSCVFPLIGGLIFLNAEKKNAFVRFYAMQSLYFGGASFVAYVVLQIIWSIIARVPVLGAILGFLLSLIWVALALCWVAIYLITILKSISGKEWEIPYLGQLARQQLARDPSG